MSDRPIGIFDSGVGGLSVWKEVVRLLPEENVIYFADSAHLPYGERSQEEVKAFSEAIVAFLVEQGAKLVVVACNTASAAALYYLRERFSIPIVGMEPAVKPAAKQTHTGKIGVIGTKVTFQGLLFKRLVERFSKDVIIHTCACPGLVEMVEEGILNGQEAEERLRDYLLPMLAEGIDVLVLGCTHYPFLRGVIEKVAGPKVKVIDPSEAVARQVKRVLEREGLRCTRTRQGEYRFYTSGSPEKLAHFLRRLLGIESPVFQVKWEGLSIKLA
ncbi:MAG: glutamate racemase [Chloroflexi bacterium]|nr:MAG: glutamate racemase [Chloroflexota bacterium]HDN79732.1 glutamate racemase [Chloroflexota bacterium]